MGTEKSVETREQELERVVQALVGTLRHMAGGQDTAYEEARWDRHEVKRELERAAAWGESCCSSMDRLSVGRRSLPPCQSGGPTSAWRPHLRLEAPP